MKTFKLIGVAILTVLLSVGFSSCSKSDDDNGGSSSNPLVGTWELSDEDGYYSTVELKADGSYCQIEYHRTTDNIQRIDKGTYKIIFINEPFDWDFVGVKSIYTGGGATNETEIQWFDVKAATGISTVKANVKATNGAMFNLAGQRVAEGYKGLVIKNGKKYVVK